MASVVRPASPDATTIAHAVAALARAGSWSKTRCCDDFLAASGLPIAAQYTARKASMQPREDGGMACDASSISFFAPVGSASVHSMVVARRRATLAWSE